MKAMLIVCLLVVAQVAGAAPGRETSRSHEGREKREKTTEGVQAREQQKRGNETRSAVSESTKRDANEIYAEQLADQNLNNPEQAEAARAIKGMVNAKRSGELDADGVAAIDGFLSEVRSANDGSAEGSLAKAAQKRGADKEQIKEDCQ